MSHSLGISKNSTAHKKTHTPCQYQSLAQITVYSVVTKNNFVCLMSYILKHRAQRPLVWNNTFTQIRKPPHSRRLSPRECQLRLRKVRKVRWVSELGVRLLLLSSSSSSSHILICSTLILSVATVLIDALQRLMPSVGVVALFMEGLFC